MQFLACARQGELGIYKVEAGFLKMRSPRVTILKGMATVSLVTGRLHLMGGVENSKIQALHFYLDELRTRPLTGEELNPV